MKNHQQAPPLSSGTWTIVIILFFIMMARSGIAFASGTTTLPDPSGSIKDFTAAGTLMGILDSFLFNMGARALAGIALLGAAWNLKEQRFAMAIICIFAAIMMGTIPMWVKNIFALDSAGGSIFKG